MSDKSYTLGPGSGTRWRETPRKTGSSRARGFVYQHANGKRVTAAAHLARIRSLALPPAYRDVWMCISARGHPATLVGATTTRALNSLLRKRGRKSR